MNFLLYFQEFIRKSKLASQAVLFYLKKPFYSLNALWSGNYFRCDSILFSGHIRIRGVGNRLIIKGGVK